MFKIRSPSFCQFVYKRLYHKGVAPFRQPHFLKSEKICIRDKYGEFSYQEINQESDKIAKEQRREMRKSSHLFSSKTARKSELGENMKQIDFLTNQLMAHKLQ